MADADDLRRLALALPDLAEIEATASTPGGRQGSSGPTQSADTGKPRLILTDTAAQFVGDEAQTQDLLPCEPDVFFTTPG